MVFTLVSFCLTVIGTALTVWSIVYAIFTTKKHNKKEKQLSTITWEQILIASNEISKSLKGESFSPDFIISPGQKGGIFAQLLMDDLDIVIPIFTGFLIPSDNRLSESIDEHKYLFCNTTKWNVYISKEVLEYKEKNVLIVDDLVMSGDFLHTIKQRLCTSGFNKKNIRFISIVTTDVAISTKKSPDYYWKKLTADECYFPWGKAK